MRTHTTLTLRNLIVNDMDVSNGTLSKQQISIWIETLPEITREMFETIYFFTHNIFTQGLVGPQVRQIHKECISLLDKIDKYQNLSQEMGALKSSTIKCLDAVMEKIESDCGNYLEQLVWMPAIHLRREQVELESQTRLIEARLKNGGLPIKLQHLVLEGMTDLLKALRCTYYRMNYMKKLQYELIAVCKDSDQASIEGHLIALLIRQNYNSGNFIKYYQQQVMDKLAGCITEEEQLKYLRNLEDDFARDPYRKSPLSYDLKRKRVKHLLCELVSAELRLRREKAMLNRPAPIQPAYVTPQRNLSPGSVPEHYKIRTPLSVDALAYLIKLMIGVKAIEPGVRTELMAFISRIFQTPGTGTNGISATSLETKYKQVVQSTAKNIRSVLVRMLKLLDDEFGLE